MDQVPGLTLRPRCGYAVDLPRSLSHRMATTSAESSPPQLRTAGAFPGESMLVATGAKVKRYQCAQCAPLRTVVEEARPQIARPLTQAERERFLRERPTNSCPQSLPSSLSNLKPCLEVFPDSGPPGTVVEIRSVGVEGQVSLVNATGTWRLGTLDAPIFGFGMTHHGTVTIPKNIP
jgi:hypothetical protein